MGLRDQTPSLRLRRKTDKRKQCAADSINREQACASGLVRAIQRRCYDYMIRFRRPYQCHLDSKESENQRPGNIVQQHYFKNCQFEKK
ncbi:unnamed protein product [Caenorhabditis auriculariae]|uniref:Uncharacterized protein n=1 Tax=Caenorhabditis auriculariae TaxID=2777116 RepID=A0A8S1H5D5_9PELO|nr:unnamed protein product [Caenorhabditis auriculariae]